MIISRRQVVLPAACFGGKMRVIRGKRAQSLVEFAIVFPFFLLMALGMVQLTVIFMNAIALKYTAFMTARVAAVYEKKEIRMEKAGKACLILKSMNSYANSMDKNPVSASVDAAMSQGLDYFMNKLNEKTGGDEGKPLAIERETFVNSGASGEAGEETCFIKVTVIYRLPLKVPIVNKIFGLFQSDIKINLREALNGNLLSHKKQEWAKFALNNWIPYYTLRAVSVMRVE
jgi:hypothetical protein